MPDADAGTSEPPDGAGTCEDRRGGALITFCDNSVAVNPIPNCESSEYLTTPWITNGAYIDEEKSKLNVSARESVWCLRDGADCDENHAWNVDPATVQFQDVVVRSPPGLHVPAVR